MTPFFNPQGVFAGGRGPERRGVLEPNRVYVTFRQDSGLLLPTRSSRVSFSSSEVSDRSRSWATGEREKSRICPLLLIWNLAGLSGYKYCREGARQRDCRTR